MAKGVGVSFKLEYETSELLRHVDFVEFMRYHLELAAEAVHEVTKEVPTVLHSLDLSPGTVGAVSRERVEKIDRCAREMGVSWISEHLSFSYAGGIAIPALIPLPYTDEGLAAVTSNLLSIQSGLSRPLIIENVTNVFVWPDNQYTEAEFIANVLEQADCGLLLDVTNLYINSSNCGYDPYEFLKRIPAERVVQLHLAGHGMKDGKPVDTHEGGIHPDVLRLAEWALKNTACDAMVIERDVKFSTFNDILSDLELCRDLYHRIKGS